MLSFYDSSHRDRAQVEQLVQYIVEDAPADAESKRAFKFPFIACEIFTCEIDVILKTLVEDEELMDLLFSFLEPNHTHNSLLSGYFSKVVVCLMLRKTASLMKYVQGGIDDGGVATVRAIMHWQICEPAVYVVESAISSGSAGTSSLGAENTAAIADSPLV
ncbi:uncharacterized protein A4U43_C04F15710 [Asparagus officinalis]|uniref:Serine/threonine-protein phosphatase 4 regulatory subunit 3-like central domain-containing protein n=1 Tax=Asparagus officinalis TaxID=4686 RepID=A0A5P1F6I3_ASPOF|nr:uncharacterized protein A4U43_C04F15710 [Asparagus officinalis]